MTSAMECRCPRAGKTPHLEAAPKKGTTIKSISNMQGRKEDTVSLNRWSWYPLQGYSSPSGSQRGTDQTLTRVVPIEY